MRARLDGRTVDVIQHINPDGSLGPCYPKDAKIKIGANNTISADCRFSNFGLSIGDNNIIDADFISGAIIGDDCIFESRSRIGDSKIGNNVLIKAGAQISDSCVIGDNVKMGRNCWIGDFTTIGDNCDFGHCTKIGLEQVVPPGTVTGEFEGIGLDDYDDWLTLERSASERRSEK